MNKNTYSLKEYVLGFTYFTLYGLVKYLPSPIFDILRFLVLYVFTNEIKSIRIKDGVTVWFPQNLSIGKNVSLNEWVFIDAFGVVKIGNYCRIAHGVSIISENHGYKDNQVLIYLQKKIKGTVVIGDNCWIGAGAKIMPNVKIGEGSVIAAGCVVTKSVPPMSIVAGVPGKIIKTRN